MATSIEDLASNSGHPDDSPLLELGDGQLSLDVGGETPSHSTIRLAGGAIAVEGELKKGTTIRLVVEAEITEVHFVPRRSRGFVVGTTRKHVAKITGMDLG